MKKKLLKLLAVMTISITALFALGITASAATAGDFTITLTEGVGDPVVGTDYTYTNGVLTILSDKDITIKNTNPSLSTTNRIEVADGISANITLAGVNIDVSGTENAAAFKIADNSTGNVTITIADGKTNTLKSGYNCAGLQKNGAYISETQGKLTITGICSLIAPGGAGIGGGISSSTITAIGGEGGAGIGGGYNGSGSNITIAISGGKVTATGGDYGAGIGGGFSSGSYITISDGTVIATGGECGAGIGGGSVGSGSNIKISGGKVTATGGECGAGIGGGGFGGGYRGSADNITISGGSVKAVAGEKYEYDGTTGFPAAIGQGVRYDSNTGVYSNGAEVTPTDGNGNNVYLLELTSATSSLKIDGKDFPINHGSDGKVYVYLPEGEHTVISDENSTTNKYAKKADNKLEAIGTAFTITGTGLVYGTDYTYPASTGVLTILSGKAMTIANVNPNTATTDRIEVADGVSANITLAGVNIDVSSQSDTAAFKIADNSTGNVTITLADGTTNTLKSGGNCAGLQKNGAYISETQGKLTITGTGSLTATGGKHAAGIGGGDGCDGSYIEISGGTVTAQGGEDGAGIGGGAGGSGSNIKISGGVVIANGGYGPYGGAGIGGGSYGSGSNITISGGAVTATGGGAVTAIGGGRGAGIGGGFSGSGSNIKISGGKVTATGGAGGAGIGGGGDGSGSYIEISGGEVTATGGTGIGGGIRGSGSYITISGGSVKADSIDCTPTDGTANATPVYLLGLDVDGTSDVTINGKAYPTKHFDENKVYIYLPAKTAQAPNEVTVGNETTKYCYINAKWLKVVDSPEADDTEFTYDGTEKTYTFVGSDYCTITGNKQTNAGTYTVTVALNDKDNTVWNDGTTDDKTFTFTIAKATVTVTAKSYTIKVGEALPTYAYDVAGLVNGEELPVDVTVSCTADGKTAGTYTITVSGAANSTNYTFAYVNGTLKVIAASAPQNVKATAGDSKITISWSAVSGATKYRVQRLNGTSWSTINYPTATSYVDTNVTAGTTYKYRVLAYVNGAWSSYSDAVSATPTASTIPQNVKAVAGDGKITISWSAVSGATKYRVQRLNGTAWSTINYPTAISYVDTAVTAGTTYKYRVLAYVDGAWGKVSSVVSATPTASTTPQNVKAVAGDGKITISWSAVSGATKYRVQRLNGTTWSTINYPTATSYVDTAVTAGTTYKYRVLTYVDGAWGKISSVVSATPIASTIPQNVKATAGDGKITISWSAVTGATKYRVQRLNGTAWSTINYPTTTSYVDTNVTAGTTYKYRVLAYVDGAWGKVSSVVSATPTASTTPQNVKATAGEGKVTISWSAVSGATKYRVQRLNGTSWSTINYPATTSYVDTNVTAGTAYKYRVLAYVDGAWSAVSVVVTATPN